MLPAPLAVESRLKLFQPFISKRMYIVAFWLIALLAMACSSPVHADSANE
jgi:hypothetical protein